MTSSEQGRQMEDVQRALEDFIVTHESLPTKTDIIGMVDFGKRRVETALKYLEKNGTIRRVYDNPGRATIWVPSRMLEALLRFKQSPPWLQKHSLDRREQLEREIRGKEDELNRLRRIEDLLYTSGRALEEAVHTALEVLKVENISACFDDSDSWDFSFSLDGRTFIAEAKGKSGPASKPDVQQLQGWLTKYLDAHPDADPDGLCGLLIVNHHRSLKPERRWPKHPDNPPLTTHAERNLRLGGCQLFLTTLDLFEVARTVIDGGSNPEQARREVMDRMRRRVSDDAGE